MSLYALTIFLSAFLLFQIQPMIAKMILPWFGGSASVWITSMLFFQIALLGGYLYAHWSVRTLKPNSQAAVHITLLGASLLLLPVAPSLAWKPAGTEDPVLRILGLLTVSIGLPYFLLSTTSPLIQAWYARTHKAALPYRLFGLSNLASLLGLLAYPVFVEPNVTLRQQSLGWSTAFAIFAALGITTAVRSRRTTVPAVCDDPPKPATEWSPLRQEPEAPLNNATSRDCLLATPRSSLSRGSAFHPRREPGDAKARDCPPPKARELVLWLLLAGCASTLLLSVTNHLTQNVASIPFLWVLPLSLYLLTFILTFDYERLYNRTIFVWLFVLALGGMSYGLLNWNSHTNIKLVIGTFSSGLFISCLFFHGELVKRKPTPQHLTSFYLMLSIGGALGGLLVGLIAPKVLPAYFELPLTLIFCSILLLVVLEYRRSRIVLVIGWAAAVAVIIVSVHYMNSYVNQVLVMARNFYGGLRVNEYHKGTNNETRVLVHGTVTHGVQYVPIARRNSPISYYGPGSGISLAEHYLRHSSLRVGVIGLGAGSLAAYARPGDVFRFYEINPLVEQLARRQFTYLEDCSGKVDVVLGDGRLSLEREPDQQYDLFVVDAFSGDAIPVHLITRQALELYFRHLKPGGILALHITNTHLDLEPVVRKLSDEMGKQAILISTDSDEQHNLFRSQWALISSQPIEDPTIENVAEDLAARPELHTWTDDYNNLFQILK